MWSDLGKILIFAGLALVAAGLLLQYLPEKAGRLPGDIVLQKGKWTLYFPLGLSILLSLLLTAVLWLFSILRK